MKIFIAFLTLVICTYGAKISHFGWRIVGGKAADDGQFPYQISLRLDGLHSCGGSILDGTTVLSAAHCVEGRNISLLTVMVGSNTLNPGGSIYKVDRFIAHPNYNSRLIQNDISIIKLKDVISFNEKVQPVKLREENIGGDEDCVLSGWGTTALNETTPNSLQWIKLKTLSVKECTRKQTVIVDSEVCTLTKIGEGACHGDSGGPLVDADGKQIGIVSWGIPCARGNPDVFTRVFSFLDWIKKNR